MVYFGLYYYYITVYQSKTGRPKIVGLSLYFTVESIQTVPLHTLSKIPLIVTAQSATQKSLLLDLCACVHDLVLRMALKGVLEASKSL